MLRLNWNDSDQRRRQLQRLEQRFRFRGFKLLAKRDDEFDPGHVLHALRIVSACAVAAGVVVVVAACGVAMVALLRSTQSDTGQSSSTQHEWQSDTGATQSAEH